MTNLEWLIAALTLQFDDAYAEQECAIHYNIKCPYYSGKHPCDDAPTIIEAEGGSDE